jgi:hypothetical protein
MLFKRFLTIWFLLFTLISSTAWATSDHADDNHNGSLSSEAAGDHQPFPSWADDACDDHCDHASAHVVGLISTVTSIKPAATAPITVIPISIPASHDPSPLFQPPIL